MGGLGIAILAIQIGIPVLFAIGGGVALLIVLCCRHRGAFGRISPSVEPAVVIVGESVPTETPSYSENVSLLSPSQTTTYTTAPNGALPQPVYYIPTAQYEPYQQQQQQY